MNAKKSRRITRGELARRTGVNIETIRYFENIGVLATPDRTEGGHRVYDEEHVRTLGFVRRARNIGFTLKMRGMDEAEISTAAGDPPSTRPTSWARTSALGAAR